VAGRRRGTGLTTNQPSPTRQQPTPRQLVALQAEHFSGPLPSPKQLADYDAVYPGAAEIIIKAFVDQGQHRMGLEQFVIHEGSKRSNKGLVYGAGVSVVAIAGSVALGYFGMQAAASVVGGSTVVALATCFVTGTVLQRNERAERRNPVANRR